MGILLAAGDISYCPEKSPKLAKKENGRSLQAIRPRSSSAKSKVLDQRSPPFQFECLLSATSPILTGRRTSSIASRVVGAIFMMYCSPYLETTNELVASLGDAEAAPMAQGVGQPRETREGAIRKNALNPVLDRGTDMGVVAAFFARVLLVPSPCLLRLLSQALSSVFSNYSNMLERFTKLATSSMCGHG